MVIDLFTKKIIPEDPILTATQSLTKSVDLEDRTGINFDSSDNNWEEVLKNNKVLLPASIINQFQAVLLSLLQDKPISKEYCQFMLEQCKDWEISDQATIIE